MTDAPTAPAAPEMAAPTVIHENLVAALAGFLEDKSKAGLVFANDPVDGTSGLFIQAPDGSLDNLDRSRFDSYRTNPVRRAGKATLLDLTSFIAHVNRFKDPDSAIFANNSRTAPSLTAVLDYHESVEMRVERFASAANEDGAVGVAGIPRPANARFGEHRGFHAFPLSDEWKAWTAKNGSEHKMSMADFAAFLEDRYVDVMPVGGAEFGDVTGRFIDAMGGVSKIASPTTLIELSRNFHVNEAATVKQATNLSSGEGGIVLESEHMDAAGVRLEIPTMFVIFIPVFKGEQAYPIIARLRYRARSGSPPVFWYELWRDDLVFDRAFDGALDRVRSETGLPVLIGSPEA